MPETDPDPEQPTGSSYPPWVRLVALVAIVALLAFVVAQVL